MGTGPRAGLVGVGRMGAVLLRCLRKRGFEVAACDTRAEALEEFASDAGVVAARSPREVARFAEVVGIVVFDDAQVLDVLEGPEGILAGASLRSVVLVHATVTAETVRRAGASAAARGVALLDAALSGGTTEQQEAGELCVMAGGDAAALERARPVLDAYAGLIEHVGPLGAGMDAKLIRNMVSFLQIAVLHEALGLGQALGIPRETVERILAYTHTMSDNARALIALSPVGRVGGPTAEPQLRAMLRYMADVGRKDLAAALARGVEVGHPLPLTGVGVERIAEAYRPATRS